MGVHNYEWEDATWQLITDSTPINLELSSDIGFEADIEASNSINAECGINNNSDVTFSAPTVTLDEGFSIELGSTLSIDN